VLLLVLLQVLQALLSRALYAVLWLLVLQVQLLLLLLLQGKRLLMCSGWVQAVWFLQVLLL
jgi:hypothetical protein